MTDSNRENEVQRTAQRYQKKAYASSYKQEYLDGWKLKNLRSRLIARAEIQAIKKAIEEVQLCGSVLDIPCGTGKLGRTLSSYPVSITAADISPEMMGLARDEYDPEKISDFIVCDAADLPLSSSSLDSIVCLRLTQRLPVEYRGRILAEFRRVARKYLVVSYSLRSPWHDLRNRFRWTYDRSNPTFFPASRSCVENELKEAGFEIIRIRAVLPMLSSQVIVTACVSAG